MSVRCPFVSAVIFITTKRGTDVIKVEDIPNVQKADLTGQIVTVNRGTEVVTL